MRLAAIDIGGGSTEITLGTAAVVQQAKSFRLGVIMLGERFVTSDPLTGGDERRMVRHIRHELGDYARRIARAGYARPLEAELDGTLTVAAGRAGG
jgi:exopolyphosphatase/guanosine-5'-triphosphate,3'-diphosphate pyrophosphatase